MLVDRTDWGKVNILLEDYLLKHKISKTKLTQVANLQYTQLQAYCKNQIQRPDLEVLARICCALECNITDIISYTPPDN